MKDYLTYENHRNKKNAAMFTAMMKACAPEQTMHVLIGHHLTFELCGKDAMSNEVPSADCLMFDHEIMFKLFGAHAIPVMQRLVSVPADRRDDLLSAFLRGRADNHIYPATDMSQFYGEIPGHA